jgi:hypothetical protein
MTSGGVLTVPPVVAMSGCGAGASGGWATPGSGATGAGESIATPGSGATAVGELVAARSVTGIEVDAIGMGSTEVVGRKGRMSIGPPPRQ